MHFLERPSHTIFAYIQVSLNSLVSGEIASFFKVPSKEKPNFSGIALLFIFLASHLISTRLASNS